METHLAHLLESTRLKDHFEFSLNFMEDTRVRLMPLHIYGAMKDASEKTVRTC